MPNTPFRPGGSIDPWKRGREPASTSDDDLGRVIQVGALPSDPSGACPQCSGHESTPSVLSSEPVYGQSIVRSVAAVGNLPTIRSTSNAIQADISGRFTGIAPSRSVVTASKDAGDDLVLQFGEPIVADNSGVALDRLVFDVLRPEEVRPKKNVNLVVPWIGPIKDPTRFGDELERRMQDQLNVQENQGSGCHCFVSVRYMGSGENWMSTNREVIAHRERWEWPLGSRRPFTIDWMRVRVTECPEVWYRYHITIRCSGDRYCVPLTEFDLTFTYMDTRRCRSHEETAGGWEFVWWTKEETLGEFRRRVHERLARDITGESPPPAVPGLPSESDWPPHPHEDHEHHEEEHVPDGGDAGEGTEVELPDPLQEPPVWTPGK